MKTRQNVVRITVISTAILGAAMLISWSSTAAPKTGLDMWGVEHQIPGRGWSLFDFVHSAGCGYCVLNAKAYQENFADGLSAAGVTTYGVDVFEEQRDLVDYVKHNRIRFPILTEPDALWTQLRCPGLPGQSLFHDGQPVFSRSETLTYLNYDRIRNILRSDDSANKADEVRPFRPPGPLKKALNCVYEDENALLVVGDSFDADARRFFPGLKRVVFRTKRASEVTDSDLGKGAVYVIGSPAENTFLGRLRGRTPFDVRGDGIAFADTLLEGDDLALWYCYTNPWNPECYLVVKTGTYPVCGEKLGYDGSQDFLIERRLDLDQDRQESSIVARGKFAKAGGEWFLLEREIDWEQASAEVPAAPMVACGTDGCPMPTPSTLTGRGPSGDGDARRGGAGDRDELFASSALELDAPLSWPGRFPALAPAADTACWVAWDQPQGGIFVARMGGDVWGPQRVWAGESAVPDAADLLGTDAGDDVDAYKPSVHSDDRGWCWVTWSQLDRGHYQVFAARVPVDGPPETWRISHRANLDHHAPAIAGNGDGTVTLTWYAWEANARRPYYRQWDGRTWSSVGRVPTQDESQFAWYLSGTAGRGGNGRWIWMQHYPSPTSIVSATVAKTGWGEPETITDAGRYPSIAFDPNTGETRAVWQQWIREGTNSTRNEWRILTSSSGGAGWSGPKQIPGCPSGRNATPVIAVDDAGQTWVFWSHKGPTGGTDNGGSVQRNWRILCSVFDTSRWQGPFAISDPRSDARSPAVASSGGSTWISWHQGSGTDLQIVVRTIRPVKSSGGEAAPETWTTSGQTSD
jgi:hypothetical protein